MLAKLFLASVPDVEHLFGRPGQELILMGGPWCAHIQSSGDSALAPMMFYLAIYGLVIFPMGLDIIDGSVILLLE